MHACNLYYQLIALLRHVSKAVDRGVIDYMIGTVRCVYRLSGFNGTAHLFSGFGDCQCIV